MTAAVDLAGLRATLECHLSAPQTSERWAMYRLVAPVIDHVNRSLGLTAFFEYSQTSRHGTHQSVDIALLDERSRPVVLIEAKRANRKVSPEQIEKYLDHNVRGIVTNGFIWILCHRGKHEVVSISADDLDLVSLERISWFISGTGVIEGKVSETTDEYSARVHPQKIEKAGKASRRQHPVTMCSTRKQLLDFINVGKDRPINELALLKAIHGALPDIGMDKFPWVEVRKSRISFFDRGESAGRRRLARIELGKRQPDLLVRTAIVDQNPQLTKIAQPAVHDKGPHMRRFRLKSADQASEFGTQLVSVLKRQ